MPDTSATPLTAAARAWTPSLPDTMACLDYAASIVDVEVSKWALDVKALRAAIEAWAATHRSDWTSDQVRTLRQRIFWALDVFDAEAWR